MNAKEALSTLAVLVSEYTSFAEGFDHEFHSNPDPEAEDFDDGDPCRFDSTDEPWDVLSRLITVAQVVVNAESDDLFEGRLQELANALQGEN